jgi:hypothetical protein
MEKFEGNNSALIKTLRLIALDSLTSIPNESSFEFSELTIAAGEQFEDIEYTHQSAKWGEKENSGKGGNFFKKEVFCLIPSVRNVISEELENYRSRKLAALITEYNGENRLVYPLRMKINTDVPGTAPGWNGYELSFSGESAFQSPTVTSVTIGSEEL